MSFIDKKRKQIFLCIGSMKHPIDCYAPKVGTILEKLGFEVIGTEKEPLHALNIPEIYENKIKHIDTSIYQTIAIDVSIATKNNDIISIEKRAANPGKGVGKKLPDLGEISILCCPFDTDNLLERKLMMLLPSKNAVLKIKECIKNTVLLILKEYEKKEETA